MKWTVTQTNAAPPSHLRGLHFVPQDAWPACEVRQNPALLPRQTRFHFTPPLLTHNGGWREDKNGTREGQFFLDWRTFKKKKRAREKQFNQLWQSFFSSLPQWWCTHSCESDYTCTVSMLCLNISVKMSRKGVSKYYLQHKRAAPSSSPPPVQGSRSTWLFESALQSYSYCSSGGQQRLHKFLSCPLKILWGKIKIIRWVWYQFWI